MSRSESYAPGWGADALAMLRGRDAGDRAASVVPHLTGGMTVVDVGCGPGTITAGLAVAVAPHGVAVGVDMHPHPVGTAGAAANLRFVQGSAYDLPVRTGSADVAYAHALFEHLAFPESALKELHRVLRPGGMVAVCSSDWSGADVDPHTADVADALAAHYLLRRRAGGDPFLGGRLPDLVAAAGFGSVRSTVHRRVDMGYVELARYVGSRASAALADATPADRPVLERGVAGATRWAEAGEGSFVQRWVEVLAVVPVSGDERASRSLPEASR